MVTECIVEVFVSLLTTAVVVCTGTDDVCTAPGAVVDKAVSIKTEMVPATTVSAVTYVVWSRVR